MHRFRDRLVEVRAPRRADDLHGVERRERGRGRRASDLLRIGEHLRHPLGIAFAEEEPDRRRARHDVRLVAAVGDDVVRALRQLHVLTVELPCVRHLHHGVQCALPTPRRRSRVGALALEPEDRRDQGERGLVAPRDAELVADVGEEIRVDVLEYSRSHEERLSRDLLLGDARPEHERAANLLAHHHVLHGERGEDVQRHTAVVPFAVSGRARYESRARRHARRLVRLRDAVDVRPQCDHW